MLPDPNFIYCPPIQTYFVDKDDGAPLSAGVVTFYEDSNRSVKKAIYEQTENPLGTFFYTELNNPVILTSVGTFADNNGNDINVFLYPYLGSPGDTVRGNIDLYYVTVESSGGVLQETRAAWPPNVQIAGTSQINSLPKTANELQNPQFVEVLFPTNASSGLSAATVFNVSGATTYTLIAPGWFMLTGGTGTVTVSQVAIGSGTPTNPPYALQIQSGAGVTSIKLVQRIYASPTLLSATIINGMVLAASLSGAGSSNVTVTYTPSNGVSTPIFTLPTTNDMSLSLLQASVTLSHTNADTAPAGYVDFVVTLVAGVEYQISSCQLTTVSAISSVVPFLELSTPLQKSGLFSYWQPLLDYKPLPSYLTAWDFPLNPAQFGATGGPYPTTNGSIYCWDQTILFGNVDNVLTYSRNASTGGLKITTGSTTTPFAIVQYLSQAQAREILSQRTSAQIKAYVSTGAGPVQGNISLWWTTAALPNESTGFSLVSTVNASTAVPSVGGGSYGTWTQVPNVFNQGSFNLAGTTPTTENTYSVSGFDCTSTAAGATATGFAIVVSFSQITSAQAITIDYVSLVGGDIATRPAPQTSDEVLRECQYYYEQSYSDGSLVGTVTKVNAQFFSLSCSNTQGGKNAYGYQTPFSLIYNTKKRAVPTIFLYSPGTGAVATIHAEVYYPADPLQGFTTKTAELPLAGNYSAITGNFSSIYTPIAINGFVGSPPDAYTGNSFVSGGLMFQYVCDARLGVVL